MRNMCKTAWFGAIAMVLLGTGFVSSASAQCASPGWNKTATIVPQSWQGPNQTNRVSFVAAEDWEGGGDDGIVGFWKVKFLLGDGTVIDNGFAQWHSDGTEIMNSSRVPATGNFCLGVWEKNGSSSYKLNHFALSYDPAGNFVGPAQIQEHVTLIDRAQQYEGTFTIDQYDPSGKLLAHITGQITAKRISVGTPITDVL